MDFDIEKPKVEAPVEEVTYDDVDLCTDTSPFQDTIPCNWNIISLYDDVIEASNYNSVEKFTGTMDVFKQKMKG